MEFFAKIDHQTIDAEKLFELVTIVHLPQLCASISSAVSTQSPDNGEIYCIWGLFQVSREKIRNGVRLALLNCPHALAWTIAVKRDQAAVVVHCTIDDEEAEIEFVESIESFMCDWEQGLKKVLGRR